MRRKLDSPKLALATLHASADDQSARVAFREEAILRRAGPSVFFRLADTSSGGSTERHTESVVSMHAPDAAVNDPHPNSGPAMPPSHPHLPSPTYWPAFLAFGITLLAWSFITSWVLTVVGILVIFVAVGGWIGDLLNEH